jgi:hypothetical protein
VVTKISKALLEINKKQEMIIIEAIEIRTMIIEKEIITIEISQINEVMGIAKIFT